MRRADVGYVRVSKREQNPDLQRRELEAAGCERVFEERVSSRKEIKPQLEAALDYCREGDVLVVWKLDRPGRSIKAVGHWRKNVRAGVLGVNVGVAAPMAFFPFNGIKDSFYGDLHATGKDGVRFFTEKPGAAEAVRMPTEGGP